LYETAALLVRGGAVSGQHQRLDEPSRAALPDQQLRPRLTISLS
jgi:hypothetical protein